MNAISRRRRLAGERALKQHGIDAGRRRSNMALPAIVRMIARNRSGFTLCSVAEMPSACQLAGVGLLSPPPRIVMNGRAMHELARNITFTPLDGVIA